MMSPATPSGKSANSLSITLRANDLQASNLSDTPAIGELFPKLAATLEVRVHLLPAKARVHLQDPHAIVEEGAVDAAQVGEIERKAVAVVETEQEPGNVATLP